MDDEELKKRTKAFALNLIKLVDKLPNSASGRVVANQLVKAGTSVAANYRAACRARSKAEFIAKIEIVQEEADESCFWLELIAESGLLPQDEVAPLASEADQLTAIFTASLKTSKERRHA